MPASPVSTYSGDPATSVKDAVRCMLGDTGGEAGTFWRLNDAEILYFDGICQPIFDDPIMTAAVCADILAGRYAGEVSISADGVSISTDALQRQFELLGASLRATYKLLAAAGGYPYIGGIDTFHVVDPSVRPMNFGVGANDNVRAGWQSNANRGGDYYDLYDSEPW